METHNTHKQSMEKKKRSIILVETKDFSNEVDGAHVMENVIFVTMAR